MYRSFYEGSDLLRWPMLAMGVFLVSFTAIVIWVLTHRASQFEAVASLPLADDDTPRSAEGEGHAEPRVEAHAGSGGSHV